ncbi:hypothetical protein HF289_12015 [Acidithiobacillus ferrooxidans]|uniref:hypothetical protein n=1 Tax=Acidithiobacillus ferrooxidans TaxID=920 RepID=UPI001C06C4E3|nr:hypothetical protein [Acidithiobacillus ferrooxidans]MBU2857562.1 hypothetical protein [Acidithiobacillus ferrooxidans]
MLYDAFAIVEFWSAALPPDALEDNPFLPGTATFHARLRTAYSFVLNRIINANANDCPGDIDEAITMLEHLRVIFHKEGG